MKLVYQLASVCYIKLKQKFDLKFKKKLIIVK